MSCQRFENLFGMNVGALLRGAFLCVFFLSYPPEEFPVAKNSGGGLSPVRDTPRKIRDEVVRRRILRVDARIHTCMYNATITREATQEQTTSNLDVLPRACLKFFSSWPFQEWLDHRLCSTSAGHPGCNAQ